MQYSGVVSPGSHKKPHCCSLIITLFDRHAKEEGKVHVVSVRWATNPYCPWKLLQHAFLCPFPAARCAGMSSALRRFSLRQDLSDKSSTREQLGRGTSHPAARERSWWGCAVPNWVRCPSFPTDKIQGVWSRGERPGWGEPCVCPAAQLDLSDERGFYSCGLGLCRAKFLRRDLAQA